MLRHAPTALQETAALFLSLGFYDSHLRSFVRQHRARWREMRAAIDRHLPDLALGQSSGGSSFWLSGSETFDAAALASRVLARGVILDPGRVFYMHADRGNAFRLGFGYIQPDRMESGLRIVAEELRP